MDEFEHAELEMEALFLAEAEVVEGAGRHDLHEAGEFFFGEQGGGAGCAAALVGGDLEELGVGVVWREAGDFREDAVAEIADELTGDLRGGVAGVEAGGWQW